MGFEKAARDAIFGTKFERVFANAKFMGFCKAVAFIAAKWVLMSTRSWRTAWDEWLAVIAWRSSPEKSYVA